MGKLKIHTVDEVYVTIFSEKIVTNENGWSKICPTDKTSPFTNNELLDEVLNLIRRKKLTSLYDFANEMNVNYSYLNGAIILFTGMCLHRFACEYLIREACELLQYTEMPVYSIAKYVNMGTPTNFCNVFRKIMNTSPHQWRTIHRNPKDIGKYKL